CYVAVGGTRKSPPALYRPAILTSTDGVNWTTRLTGGFPVPTGMEMHGVAFGLDQFVAVGRPGAVLNSPDGVTWTTNQFVFSMGYLKSVAFGNGVFVVVGEKNLSLTSTDGRFWTSHTPLPAPSEVDLDEVRFGDGVFVAVGDEGTILTSTNG